MSSRQTLDLLFALCHAERKRKVANRLKGRHCVARMKRGQAKRIKAGMTPYGPWSAIR